MLINRFISAAEDPKPTNEVLSFSCDASAVAVGCPPPVGSDGVGSS